MNQKVQQDLWQQISIPYWMLQNVNSLEQQSPFVSQNLSSDEKSLQNDSNHSDMHQKLTKRNFPVCDQPSCSRSLERSSSDLLKADYSGCEEQSCKRDHTMNAKNKLQKRCQNSKKYRQRKKQYFKSLQEENQFLKFKVDELTFRLHEMEMEINRLKNNDPLYTHSFQTLKSGCLKEIEKMLKEKVEDVNEYIKVENKLKEVVSFNSKQKIDYLNYFMSELLENVLSDRTFYFIDSLVNKKGLHRVGETELRKIDLEVFDILKINDASIKDVFIDKQKSILTLQSKKIQEMWKKLYQVYLAILNQGLKVERIVEAMKIRLFNYVKITDFLKLELHFQKNKHRADIRYLRNSWFKEVEDQSIVKQVQRNIYPMKKTKLSY